LREINNEAGLSHALVAKMHPLGTPRLMGLGTRKNKSFKNLLRTVYLQDNAAQISTQAKAQDYLKRERSTFYS
jgi:hypothetical protein